MRSGCVKVSQAAIEEPTYEVMGEVLSAHPTSESVLALRDMAEGLRVACSTSWIIPGRERRNRRPRWRGQSFGATLAGCPPLKRSVRLCGEVAERGRLGFYRVVLQVAGTVLRGDAKSAGESGLLWTPGEPDTSLAGALNIRSRRMSVPSA